MHPFESRPLKLGISRSVPTSLCLSDAALSIMASAYALVK
jgi:hypothetical protein